MTTVYKFEKGEKVRVVTPRPEIPEIKQGDEGRVITRRYLPKPHHGQPGDPEPQYFIKFRGKSNGVSFTESALERVTT